jgi:DNA polymerase-1
MTQSTWDPQSVPVTFINRADQLSELDVAVAKSVRVAVDTETHDATSFIDGLWSALRVIAVATRDADGNDLAFVIDVRDIPVAVLAASMEKIVQADGWNVNFDQRVLRLAGCDVQSWRDLMHVDGVLHSGLSGFEFWHGLAHAAKKWLGVSLSGKGTTQTSYDGSTDLSEEQIRYAGADAVVTLHVGLRLDEEVLAAGLTNAVDREVAARPFIFSMMEHGMPFDAHGWNTEVIAEHAIGREEALAELAALTGGGETTLFGEAVEPAWNPDSDKTTREALNKHARDAVMAFNGGRLMEATDKLDKTTLKQIKHPLAKALLKYREHAKTLSTYGENLNKFVVEGRIRPQYKQGGVVATGRLASDKPNAQNLDPEMKRYFRPSPEIVDGVVVPRAFVYADLSQAELRVLAQVSGEERMRELFRLGGDFHARTAADMFGVDMDALKDADPNAHSNNRKKAKGVNFGIPYGLGAAALATNLTVNSKLQTSREEAAAMLANYAKAYPAVDAWLGARDRFVKETAANPGPIDWDASFRLHELWTRAESARKAFKRSNGYVPSGRELAAVIDSEQTLRPRLAAELARPATDDDLEQHWTALGTHLDWAFTFDRPVVLRQDGSIWTFDSRTLTGRRRLFSVSMDSSVKDKFEGIITSAAMIIATSDKAPVAELRARFAEEHGIKLPVGINRYSGPRNGAFEARKRERMEVIKAFEGDKKWLKYELIKFVEQHMTNATGEIIGRDAVRGFLLPAAISDQVRAKGNQFRNHPIQSLVADLGLQYYADLDSKLKKYRNAFPVQAVHDSIAIECDLAEAPALCLEVQQSLEKAMAYWCPDVPAKADADIRLSLADDDVIDPDLVPAKIAEIVGNHVPSGV